MSVFKSVCFSLLAGVLLSCNISMAQEDMSADDLNKRVGQYYDQKDYKNAMHWYLKAADKGDFLAMREIAMFYENGEGVKQDYQQAMQWWLKSSDKGNTYATIKVGYFYYKGLGVKQNYQQAMHWYLKAADKGNALAMHNIGVLYNNGLGVEKDSAKAEFWYQKSTTVNNPCCARGSSLELIGVDN